MSETPQVLLFFSSSDQLWVAKCDKYSEGGKTPLDAMTELAQLLADELNEYGEFRDLG